MDCVFICGRNRDQIFTFPNIIYIINISERENMRKI